jgi:hypothetical protein
MNGVDIQYQIADSDPNVAHVTEDVLVSYGVMAGCTFVKKVHDVEQIPDRVYGDVEDTLMVDQLPELLVYEVTDTKQWEWSWDDLVVELFWRRATSESLLASSHVVDTIFGEHIAVDHQTNFGWQGEEVESLLRPVAEFELLTKPGQ